MQAGRNLVSSRCNHATNPTQLGILVDMRIDILLVLQDLQESQESFLKDLLLVVHEMLIQIDLGPQHLELLGLAAQYLMDLNLR